MQFSAHFYCRISSTRACPNWLRLLSTYRVCVCVVDVSDRAAFLNVLTQMLEGELPVDLQALLRAVAERGGVDALLLGDGWQAVHRSAQRQQTQFPLLLRAHKCVSGRFPLTDVWNVFCMHSLLC